MAPYKSKLVESFSLILVYINYFFLALIGITQYFINLTASSWIYFLSWTVPKIVCENVSYGQIFCRRLSDCLLAYFSCKQTLRLGKQHLSALFTPLAHERTYLSFLAIILLICLNGPIWNSKFNYCYYYFFTSFDLIHSENLTSRLADLKVRFISAVN